MGLKDKRSVDGQMLTWAKRIYKTWKHHPDMIIEAEQAVDVIEVFIDLSKEIKKLYEEEKEKCQKNTMDGN